MSKFLASLLILSSAMPATADSDVSFRGLPPATSVRQARAQQPEVYKRIVFPAARLPLEKPPVPPKAGFGQFAETMLSRMIQRQDLAAVSENLLSPNFHPWLTGTDIDILGPLCKRVGDYDFVLQILVRMAYIDDEAGRTILTEPARRKLRDELLSERGVNHHIKITLNNCPKFIKVTDTENHILMTETARYLTNQLIFDETKNPAFDNSKNGFDDWFVNQLSQFLRQDFSELNSKPYQGYTEIALGNLYSYARGSRVKTMAQMILDYLAAKSALQSNGLRRRPPFRRQKEWRDWDDLQTYDNGMQFFTPDTGNYEYIALHKDNSEALHWDGESYTMFMAATDKYEVPDAILDLFVSPSPNYQLIHHRDVEIYAPSTNFLIGAGGRFRSQFGFFTGQNDEWGVSTIVIPAHAGLLKSEMFYIDGPTDWHKKNNLCVAPGFACGENFHAPVAPNATSGNWSFYNTPDFYLAAYQEPPYAMIEVRERTLSFDDFKAEVLKNNIRLVKGQPATYRTTRGETVVFYPETGQVGQFPIVSINGYAQERDTSKWPFLKGTVMKSTGDGLITIENKKTRERLILDDRNIQNPVRRTETF